MHSAQTEHRIYFGAVQCVVSIYAITYIYIKCVFGMMQHLYINCNTTMKYAVGFVVRASNRAINVQNTKCRVVTDLRQPGHLERMDWMT
jgi:hypothetical protein